MAEYREEAEKYRKEAEKYRAEAEKQWVESQAEYEKRQKEYQAEYEKRQKEYQAAYEKRQTKLDAQIAATNASVNGISDSNGMFAEELFFNTLSEKKEFAGIHFDDVADDFGYMLKLSDGTRLKDQFDIVMLNDVAVALVEVKYRARKADVKTLAGQKVKNFKILFPVYKDLKIYLGLGALAYEDDVIDEARKYGIGLLKQVGNAIEYETDWAVKAY